MNDFLKDEQNVSAIVTLAEDVVVNLEKYKAVNVNKYYREMELEFTEYSKAEKYKNRTRVVDCFLVPLRTFLQNVGKLITASAVDDEREIP